MKYHTSVVLNHHPTPSFELQFKAKECAYVTYVDDGDEGVTMPMGERIISA